MRARAEAGQHPGRRRRWPPAASPTPWPACARAGTRPRAARRRRPARRGRRGSRCARPRSAARRTSSITAASWSCPRAVGAMSGPTDDRAMAEASQPAHGRAKRLSSTPAAGGQVHHRAGSRRRSAARRRCPGRPGPPAPASARPPRAPPRGSGDPRRWESPPAAASPSGNRLGRRRERVVVAAREPEVVEQRGRAEFAAPRHASSARARVWPRTRPSGITDEVRYFGLAEGSPAARTASTLEERMGRAVPAVSRALDILELFLDRPVPDRPADHRTARPAPHDRARAGHHPGRPRLPRVGRRRADPVPARHEAVPAGQPVHRPARPGPRGAGRGRRRRRRLRRDRARRRARRRQRGLCGQGGQYPPGADGLLGRSAAARPPAPRWARCCSPGSRRRRWTPASRAGPPCPA